MKSRSSADRSPTSGTAQHQRVASSESNGNAPSPTEPELAAASLVRHVSTELATSDAEEVVSLLSKALDLAKAELREARGSGAQAHHRLDPSYWIG